MNMKIFLKTTAVMIVGVIPLVTASGAGAEGRYNMGLVIMTALAIGTLFTIFVVPGMYLLLQQNTLKRERNKYK